MWCPLEQTHCQNQCWVCNHPLFLYLTKDDDGSISHENAQQEEASNDGSGAQASQS